MFIAKRFIFYVQVIPNFQIKIMSKLMGTVNGKKVDAEDVYKNLLTSTPDVTKIRDIFVPLVRYRIRYCIILQQFFRTEINVNVLYYTSPLQFV